ncbi:MAG TPA: hypothetical protein VGO67_23495 [Verrucomicrobiae bacterium]|jgi:hypothetical protein
MTKAQKRIRKALKAHGLDVDRVIDDYYKARGQKPPPKSQR